MGAQKNSNCSRPPQTPANRHFRSERHPAAGRACPLVQAGVQL